MTDAINRAGTKPGIGHNSHSGSCASYTDTSADTGTIAAIRQIHRDNAENLESGRVARGRRDTVLTEAALVTAELLATDIQNRPDDLATLASALDVNVAWRWDRVATTLARLVCGPGRTMNTYGNLAAAALRLAQMPGDERRTYLKKFGGVTGTAQEARRNEKYQFGLPQTTAAEWVDVHLRIPRELYERIYTNPGAGCAAMLRAELKPGRTLDTPRLFADNL